MNNSFIAQADHSASHAILDTGASRCVIGSVNLNHFLEDLQPDIRQAIKRVDSKVKFRFGNGEHLTSECKGLLPLQSGEDQKRLWLTVEVVPGSTPFLFSKRAFKLLGGALDTRNDTCLLHRLNYQCTCSQTSQVCIS